MCVLAQWEYIYNTREDGGSVPAPVLFPFW